MRKIQKKESSIRIVSPFETEKRFKTPFDSNNNDKNKVGWLMISSEIK